MINKLIFSLLILNAICSSLYSQDEHKHKHSINEIGVSLGTNYTFGHNEWGSGLHVHYLRALNPHSKWSVGGGIEYLKADEDHFSLEVGVNYRLLEKMSIGVLPSITFLSGESHEHNSKSFVGIHFEFVYDLVHLEKFHFGPAIDYSLSKFDKHLSFGIHGGYCF